MTRNISIIVAVAENDAIGLNNSLLCHLPNDLKWFKKNSTNSTVIMGKNTWLSLPKKPLPHRINIVITDNSSDSFEGAHTVFSIEQAVNRCVENEEVFIIGGASIYQQFYSMANKLYLTKIHHTFEADTYFPKVEMDKWKINYEQFCAADAKNEFAHTFYILERL
jgi:dihydrofolate reductase